MVPWSHGGYLYHSILCGGHQCTLVREHFSFPQKYYAVYGQIPLDRRYGFLCEKISGRTLSHSHTKRMFRILIDLTRGISMTWVLLSAGRVPRAFTRGTAQIAFFFCSLLHVLQFEQSHGVGDIVSFVRLPRFQSPENQVAVVCARGERLTRPERINIRSLVARQFFCRWLMSNL